MYSENIFLFVAVIDILLTFYAVSSKKSDYYKDLIALGLATFLSVYLAQAAASGVVILNGPTTQSYLMDAGLMWIGYLIAVCQGFILLLEGIETVQDYYAQKKMARLIT